jgi:hypothetical protein
MGRLTDPQSMNRYAYARDNPEKYVDPTGRYWWNPFTWNSEQQAWLVVAGLGVLTVASGGLTAPILVTVALGIGTTSAGIYTYTSGPKATALKALEIGLVIAVGTYTGVDASLAIDAYTSSVAGQAALTAAVSGMLSVLTSEVSGGVTLLALGSAIAGDLTTLGIDNKVGSVLLSYGTTLGLAFVYDAASHMYTAAMIYNSHYWSIEGGGGGRNGRQLI